MKKMRKLAILSAACLVFTGLTALPAEVTAVRVQTTYSGYCGTNGETNISWTLDTETGVLEITGSGEMPEGVTYTSADSSGVTASKGPWANRTAFLSVTISPGITSICDGAFSDCTGLTSITIPNTVTDLGSNTFYGCSGLTEVSIPGSVTSIGELAFYCCSGLTDVTIQNGVTGIERGAFSDCTNLTSVTLPDTMKSLGSGAFQRSGLTEITIPKSVTSINYSFAECKNLTDITILNPQCDIGWMGEFSTYQITIHGYSGSTAEKYAQSQHHNFVALDGTAEPEPPQQPDDDLRGDIDRDGAVTAADAQYVLNYYVANTLGGNHLSWEDLIG